MSNLDKCLIDKDFNLNKRRTSGIIVGATSCGLILSFDEMIKSESLSLVSNFLFKNMLLSKKSFKYCIYDNACHLSEYIRNNVNTDNGINNNLLIDTNFIIEFSHW